MLSIDLTTEFTQQFGQQLRQTREIAGITVDEVATCLKMHAGVVQALEAGDWQRLGAPVFIRGQLRSYGQMLAVDLTRADEYLNELEQRVNALPTRSIVQAPLLPQEHRSRIRPLLLSGLGIVLTVIVIWMLAHWYLSGADRVTTSLNIPQVLVPETKTLPDLPAPLATQQAGHPLDGITPLLEAPLPAMSLDDGLSPPPEQPVDTPPGGDDLMLTLRVRTDSWVGLYTSNGQVIEQALLHAGDVRHFRPGQSGRVVLGNAAGVDVLRGNVIQDLSAFQRANVARFAVSSDGALGQVLN